MLEQFPLLPEKISDQDVGGGVGRRPGEVVKQKMRQGIFDMPASRLTTTGGNKKMNRAIKTVLSP